jgi:hypothetical protein
MDDSDGRTGGLGDDPLDDDLDDGALDDDPWVEEAEAGGDLGEYTGERLVDEDGGADAEDEMLLSWSDDDDALGTESGGFGPDRPRDAAMPGLYGSDEIDDVTFDGEAVDAADFVDPADEDRR